PRVPPLSLNGAPPRRRGCSGLDVQLLGRAPRRPKRRCCLREGLSYGEGWFGAQRPGRCVRGRCRLWDVVGLPPEAVVFPLVPVPASLPLWQGVVADATAPSPTLPAWAGPSARPTSAATPRA